MLELILFNINRGLILSRFKKMLELILSRTTPGGLYIWIIVLKFSLRDQLKTCKIRVNPNKTQLLYIYIYSWPFISKHLQHKTKNLNSSIYKVISWLKQCYGLVDGCIDDAGRVCWVVVWRGVRSCGDDDDSVLIGASIGVDVPVYFYIL